MLARSAGRPGRVRDPSTSQVLSKVGLLASAVVYPTEARRTASAVPRESPFSSGGSAGTVTLRATGDAARSGNENLVNVCFVTFIRNDPVISNGI